jgi:hypothetical protein
MILGCGGFAARPTVDGLDDLDSSIQERVLKGLIHDYDQLERQFDDPVGRNYCLAFDAGLQEVGRPPDAAFMVRFDSHPQVHTLGWCQQNQGRILSVGPVKWTSTKTAEVWSFSWVESRPSGSDCLHRVQLEGSTIEVDPDCIEGNVYN